MRTLIDVALALLLLAAPAATRAGVAYPDPEGGWDYVYGGDAAGYGEDEFGALDGQWQHDQSDKWDGSAPGTGQGAPGGVEVQSEGDTTWLRIQDTGNPSLWGFEEPSNRRFYFGHDIATEHPGATSVLTHGITLSFRARLASGSGLDSIYPDTVDFEFETPNLTEITAWPTATGKGYNVKDDGKGMFTVQENGTNAVGFALALDLDTPAGVGAGLVMNNRPEALLPGSDRGAATTANLVPIPDAELLAWHEFWITIQDANGDFAYEVDVYRDGRVRNSFTVKSSFGAEFPGQYIAFGLPSESSFGAVDIDFYAYELGVVTPVPEPCTPLACGAGLGALGALGALRRR